MKFSLSIPLATVFVLFMTLVINIAGLYYSLDKYFPEYLDATQTAIRQQIDTNPEKLQALFAINSLDNSTQEDYQSAINELSNISNSLESLSKNPELYVDNNAKLDNANKTSFQIRTYSDETLSMLQKNISAANILSAFSSPFSFDSNSAEGKFLNAVLWNFLIINGSWMFFITMLYLIWVRRIFRPIHLIIDSLKNFSTHHKKNNVMIFYKKNDEFLPLIRTLNELQTSLAQQEQIRNQFLADLSHEIRTPMTAISGLLEAIDDGIIEFNKSTILALQSEMRRLVKITEHIMKNENFLSENNTSTEKRMVPIFSIFSDIIQQYEPQNQKKNQKIFAKIPKNATIFANEEQFIQILHNIFSNFYKYAGENTRLECDFSVDSEKTVLTFADNGKWVDDKDLPFITEKFFQADGARHQNSDEISMGIGLSLVEKIMKIHNGILTITPTKPHWLTFILTFFHHE